MPGDHGLRFGIWNLAVASSKAACDASIGAHVQTLLDELVNQTYLFQDQPLRFKS
jgi:hypothetical protein